MTLCSKLVMMSHLHLRTPSLSTMCPWDQANVSHNCAVSREQRFFWCLSKIPSATKLQSLLSGFRQNSLFHSRKALDSLIPALLE